MSHFKVWEMAQYYVGIGMSSPAPLADPKPLIECPKCGSWRIGQFTDKSNPYGWYYELNPLHLYEDEDFERDEDHNIRTPLDVVRPFEILVNVCHACTFMWNPDYKEPDHESTL